VGITYTTLDIKHFKNLSLLRSLKKVLRKLTRSAYQLTVGVGTSRLIISTCTLSKLPDQLRVWFSP
jgi:hypothetical protein